MNIIDSKCLNSQLLILCDVSTNKKQNYSYSILKLIEERCSNFWLDILST
jgi:hypothetical protein